MDQKNVCDNLQLVWMPSHDALPVNIAVIVLGVFNILLFLN